MHMAKPRLDLAVQYACARAGLPHRRSIARAIGLALRTDADHAGARIAVRFVGAAEGRTLNRSYRGRDYATNVLTFAYPESAVRGAVAPAAEPRRARRRDQAPAMLAGDLVLCAPVVRREARDQNKELSAHYAHLLIHGTLHLLGYDHERGGAAPRMERLEARLLAQLGYPDPYR